MRFTILAFALFLVVLVSGCTELMGTSQPEQPGDVMGDGDVMGNGTPDDSPALDEEDREPLPARGLPSPILCNDRLIEQEILAELGQDYSVSRGTPSFGGLYTGANCFVRSGNITIITYTISEHIDNDTAVGVLEDEREQYQQQLFTYDLEDSTIGSIGYLFEQPVANGAFYRLIFVDDTNTKVVVFVKSNVDTVPRETVETVATALARVI